MLILRRMAAADMFNRVRRRTTPDEMRARILDVAEEQFRRAGLHKTSVGDIASELGMSAANIYRFFPSRDAINCAICNRIVKEIEDIAAEIAGTNLPASEKLERLLRAIHQHNRRKLTEEARLYDLIVVAVRENWDIIRVHTNRMQAIFEGIMRQGAETGEFDLDDPAEAARAIRVAFVLFLHPVLINHCVQHGDDTDAGLREQVRFIQKALIRTG